MVKNPLIRPTPKAPKFDSGNKSAGILDDYAVRKNIASREGTVEKVPVNDSDIVNKKYVDDENAKTGKPAFSAYPSNVQEIPNAEVTKLTYDTEHFDSDGKYDAANSKFTPTVAGYYLFFVTIYIPTITHTQYQVRFLKNGASAYVGFPTGGPTAWLTYLDEDDYVETATYQNSGGAVNTYADGTFTVFQGFRVA